MPANKNQIRRIQTILKMMRQGRYPNFSSFIKEMRNLDAAGAFDLSRKTFTRDIADLRDEYGAPVRYDASRRGFYLTNPEWFNEELMVEPFQMKAMLLGERVTDGILPEPVRSEVNKAISTLLMKNESGMAEGVELENFQVLNLDNLPKISPEIFLTAYNAWEQHKTLKLTYCSAQKHATEKIFDPHVFAWNGGCWYLKGRLLSDNDTDYTPPKIQVLALHRIEKAEILNGHFWPEPSILKDVKENGLFDVDKLPEIDIEVFPPYDQMLAPCFADRIIERKENSIRIRIKNIPEYQAIQLIFYTVGNVKIHAPLSLKEKVLKIIEKLQKNLLE